MNDSSEIIVIGAGAAGLMTARELAKEGQKVTILEARERVGGRIMPLNKEDFNTAAEGGAEFLHGETPVTRALMKEAGLTFVPEEGEIWSLRNEELVPHKQFIQNHPFLQEKLHALLEDISVADFLEQNFTESKDLSFKNSVIKAVEGYDAADPALISMFTLRNEWLGKLKWDDGKIKEGYSALIDFLKNECEARGVKILLGQCVTRIEKRQTGVCVYTKDSKYEASKVVVTVPISVIKNIEFTPQIDERLEAISKIGFGHAVKLIMKFRSRWWEKNSGKDLSKMLFLLSNEKFLTWWTQYPEQTPILTGWMGGLAALEHEHSSDEELLDIAITSLSNMFKVDKKTIMDEIVTSQVINWQADPFSRGAYSYTTIHTKDAYSKAAEPIDNMIFFAGEALFSGEKTATVEGALGSGLDVVKKILNK